MEVITTHMNADFDSLASMVAAKKLYPEAVMCVVMTSMFLAFSFQQSAFSKKKCLLTGSCQINETW